MARAASGYVGFNLLPKLIKAETDDDQVSAIEGMFRDSYNDLDLYGKAIPFIIYKSLSSELQAYDDLQYEAAHLLAEL